MRFLLDENLEHEVYHRLENFGPDLLHVEVSDGLRKGDSDETLAERSREEGWIIVTYDDDFWTEFPESTYGALLYFPDQSLSARQVAEVLHEVSTYYDRGELVGSQKIGRSWLD